MAESPARSPFGRRWRCIRRSSATKESISFSPRGLLTAASRESVTPEIADTTRNRRVASSRIKPPIRRYMSGSLTQAPPNFASFANSAEISPPVGEFGVEDTPSRAPANGVVREDEELQDPVCDADSTDRCGHAARTGWLAGHKIPQGLRAVLLRADDHGPLGGRGQLPALRFSPERGQDPGDFLRRDVLRERDGDGLEMTVPDRHAGTVRPYVDPARGDSIGPCSENFLRFASHLFLLALDERQHVAGDVERRDARISGARERLVGCDVDRPNLEDVGEGPEREDEPCDRTVRVRHQETASGERWLALDQRDMVRVDLRHEEQRTAISKIGWSWSRPTNRWPIAPVAPRTATGIFVRAASLLRSTLGPPQRAA